MSRFNPLTMRMILNIGAALLVSTVSVNALKAQESLEKGESNKPISKKEVEEILRSNINDYYLNLFLAEKIIAELGRTTIVKFDPIDLEVDYDELVGKLKIAGKSDAEIREIMKDANVSDSAIDCWLQTCKEAGKISNSDRDALLSLVSSPHFDRASKEKSVKIGVKRNLLLGKLQLVGKSPEEVEKALMAAGASRKEAACVTECPESVSLTMAEFRDLTAAANAKREVIQALRNVGLKVEEDISNESLEASIKSFIKDMEMDSKLQLHSLESKNAHFLKQMPSKVGIYEKELRLPSDVGIHLKSQKYHNDIIFEKTHPDLSRTLESLMNLKRQGKGPAATPAEIFSELERKMQPLYDKIKADYIKGLEKQKANTSNAAANAAANEARSQSQEATKAVSNQHEGLDPK